MSCLRRRTFRISVATPSTIVPKLAAFRTRWATLALHNSFLEGRHATAGHEPPTQRRSTTATFLPDRPRCQARCFPPWPLPRMTTSKVSGWDMVVSLLLTSPPSEMSRDELIGDIVQVSADNLRLWAN